MSLSLLLHLLWKKGLTTAGDVDFTKDLLIGRYARQASVEAQKDGHSYRNPSVLSFCWSVSMAGSYTALASNRRKGVTMR
jgi:hypothetical protein